MKSTFKYFIGALAAIFIVAASASAATTLTPKQGGTGLAAGPTKGDLMVGSSSVTYAKLGVGTNGKCLTASSTATYGVSWETCTSSSGTVTGTSTQYYFPFWSSTSTLSNTSSILQSSSTAGFVSLVDASGSELARWWTNSTNNLFFGYQAGKLGGGTSNTFIGQSAAANNTISGTRNTLLGNSAGVALSSGGDNTGVGMSALSGNGTGNFNTAVGSAAGFSTTGSSNLFLGYNAGRNEAGSNKLYIANSSSTLPNNPLIYGDFSTPCLVINGTTTVCISTFNVSGTAQISGNTQIGGTLNATGTLSQANTPVVVNTRAVNTGTGLTGGGNLSADRTVSLNINSGTTQNCSAGQFANSLTGVGIIGCGSPSGSLKLPTITVASSSADYSNLSTAVAAAANTTNYPDGALLYLPDSSYTVTNTLKLANGVNIVGNPHQTTISFSATSTGSATNPGSILFAASGTTPGNIGLSNLILTQTSSTAPYAGTALNLSNMSLTKANNIQSLGFKYGIYANDTANNTFYNNITNWASFDDNCIYASSTNPFNDNTFINIRCGFNSGNNATSSPTYGLYLNNGQNNNFYNFNAEPAHSAGTIGVDLQTANSLSNSFFGLYAEANATSVLIGSSAANNNFFGGQVCCHVQTSISDSGNRNLFLGVNDNFTGLASSSIPAPLSVKDYSANSLTNLFQNNNSFAHIGSNLVTMKLLNGSDTSGVLKLDNAGTGPSLVVKGGTVVATGTAATVSSCGTSPSIVGTSFAGKVTTGSNASSTCKVTFPVNFQATPSCVVTSQTTSSIGYVAVTTTSTLTIQTASSSAFASNQLNYICIGF